MWQLILLLSILIVSLVFYPNFSTVGAFTEGLDNREDHKAEPKAAAKPAQAGAAAGHAQAGAAAGHAQAGAAAGHAQAGAAAKPAQAVATAPHVVNRDTKPVENPRTQQMEKKPEPKGNAHAATTDAKQSTNTGVTGTTVAGAAAEGAAVGGAVGTAAAASGTGASTSNTNKYDSNAIYSPPPSWMNKNTDTQGSAYASKTDTRHSAQADLPPIQQNTFNQTYSQSICPQSTIENFAASLTIFKNAIDTFIQCLERTNNPHYYNLIQKLKNIQTSMNNL
jgi:hypothetical protein